MAEEAGASEAQLDALSDGKVTFAEYEDATHAALDCMRAAGIHVEGGDEVDTTGRLQYSFGVPALGLSEQQILEIADECLATNSEFVDTAYQDALNR